MTKRGQNWTALLKEAGLSSPGYDEAVIATAKTVAHRKLIEKNKDDAKMKSKKRKGR